MPESQAHEMVRDFTRLPETPAPETWTTTAPAEAAPEPTPVPYWPQFVWDARSIGD
jgi:hypothetical protein